MIHQELADHFQVFRCVRNQALFGRMVLLDGLEDFGGLFAGINLPGSLCENLLLAAQFSHADLQQPFR